MPNIKKYILILLSVLTISAMAIVGSFKINTYLNLSLAGAPAAHLVEHGVTFRDLNKNGTLDVYENPNYTVEARVEDLLSRMNLEEKAGAMFISPIAVGDDGALQEHPSPSNLASLLAPANSSLVLNKLMNHFNVVFLPETSAYARWQNTIQALAERTRLGIPVTIASDPRHAFGHNPAASLPAENFSLWPEPLGFAASRDVSLTRQFAEIARKEYRAAGIHLALHPQADLATEPRWSRAAGTFGEDATLSAQLVKAYVEGFQGVQLSNTSVATMVKHFPGGGPQKDGDDAHFAYGRDQVYPGNNFDYHLKPFTEGAFPAGVAQVMPYYGIPLGQTSEDVGFGFNKEIVTGLLREKYGFKGVICSDWGVISDSKIAGLITFMEARSWGVETLTEAERMVRLLDAGIDQFGGESIPEVLIQLVEDGVVKESRLDESVRRILRDKFALGLFDNPYVDPVFAQKVVGNAAYMQAGVVAQRKSLVLLKNGNDLTGHYLPLQGRPKIYVENVEEATAAKYGVVVSTPEQADIAILRIAAPYQPKDGFFEQFFHSGDLDFKDPEKQRLLDIMQAVPTVVDIYLDRAAVIPEITAASKALIANFGATDEVVLDAIFGKYSPSGKLPIELPSSMAAVRKQLEDVPYDSEDPLFPYGFGLTYSDKVAR